MSAEPVRHHPRSHSHRLQGFWRRVGHLLMVVGGWVLFIWLWLLALGHQNTPRELQWLVIGAIVISPAVTLAWVAHNVGIFLRKGPRRNAPLAQPRADRDFNGRRIEADWRALRRSSWIEVDLHDEVKRFVPRGPRA